MDTRGMSGLVMMIIIVWHWRWTHSSKKKICWVPCFGLLIWMISKELSVDKEGNLSANNCFIKILAVWSIFSSWTFTKPNDCFRLLDYRWDFLSKGLWIYRQPSFVFSRVFVQGSFASKNHQFSFDSFTSVFFIRAVRYAKLHRRGIVWIPEFINSLSYSWLTSSHVQKK